MNNDRHLQNTWQIRVIGDSVLSPTKSLPYRFFCKFRQKEYGLPRDVIFRQLAIHALSDFLR